MIMTDAKRISKIGSGHLSVCESQREPGMFIEKVMIGERLEGSELPCAYVMEVSSKQRKARIKPLSNCAYCVNV